ncbi:iron-sulfur cluster biogenesis protein NfuA [Sediminimonas qiaohouensis]|uniref:iron-sulfur cluster biogenesis protein NfuA n=1 Tax=Sediminimonas qiaohouensis TaxID=552061 RepID=UPI0003F9FBF2|nr:iron-sulfur cluster biogenesis protein NfuA [Sediminimonas qiaohouensis]
MSETSKHARRIRAQASPRDPLTMRFILDEPVQAGCSVSHDSLDAATAPLPRALFAVDGVDKLHVAGETVTVTRKADADWQALKPRIAAAIRQVLDATDAPLGDDAGAPEAAQAGDTALLNAARHILDQQANPAIASHGGHVTAERAENGVIYLRMSGGCQGCAASAATLRNGIETMLRNALPEIRDIVDVTDHAAGDNPFYSETPGQSPVLNRPIPPGAIVWEDGQFMIDPDYLAPRLGLDAEGLREGLRKGTVVSHSESGVGADAGQTRITIRSAQRAWAAEVAPDGAAREVPPPRGPAPTPALADKLRQYLETLAPRDLPITYGKLARAMGMYAPGSVRKVTRALEETMREDAAAGRPFVAARVVGRGTPARPGQGFFDLARELGRGPGNNQTEDAYFTQEFQASTAV